jgi:hypothetical protein
VADGAGGDLDDGNTGFAQTLSVIISGQIADDNSSLKPRVKQAHGFTQESRLARARGGNHVQHQQTVGPEEATITFGEAIIFLENRPVQFEGSPRRLVLMRMSFFVMSVSMGMRMDVAMLFPVVMAGSMLVLMA